jgi:hypothetical protein
MNRVDSRISEAQHMADQSQAAGPEKSDYRLFALKT